MNAFTRTLTWVAFLGCAVLAPWWLTVAFGIALLSQGSYGIVVLGGIIMDYIFGAPLSALGGFATFYTALFVFLAVVAWYLKLQVLE